MLQLVIPPVEYFDSKNNEIFYTSEHHIQLEHSLVSVSKWESKWCKPFLTSKDKTNEETLDYIRCMTITQNVDPVVYTHIRKEQIDIVSDYIDNPMSATTFSKSSDKVTNKEVVTSELVYYWMTAFQINWEAQKWHLNRLLTLINICSIKNQPKKKMNRKEALRTQRELNEARKAKFNTSG